MKQELFAQNYVTNGGNASMAYRAAYDAGKMKPETINARGYDLTKHSQIAERIKELQQTTAKKFEITRESLTAELMKILKIASDDDKSDLSRKTVMDIAKLNGLIIDKAVVDMSANVKVMDAIKKNSKKIDFDIGD